MIWRELEAARAAVAAELGVEAQPLTMFDSGQHELAERLSAARARGPDEVAKLVQHARHAIAMAKLETALGVGEFAWLTGAIFADRNFRRLAGATPEGVRKRAGPRSTGPPAQERRRNLKPM